DMMASQLFENEYFMYGLQTFAESNNTDMFEYMEKDFGVDELEGIQSSNADVIGNIEMLYQLATGINEPASELVEGLKLVTEFVQDENATQDDYKTLERKLSELKASYYSVSK
ncbi:pathogenicity island protein, partial [Staphylococcus epidermidis]|nr:pathogenicity island protein [Staphylococcus epidermidis]